MQAPGVRIYDHETVPITTDNPFPTQINGVDYVPGQSGIDASTEVLETIEYEHAPKN